MSYHHALAGRCSIEGQIYHITVCTRHRRRLFDDWHAGRLVIGELRHLQEQQQAQSLAWVLMPEHLHWLLQLNEAASLAGLIHTFKGRSARRVNHHLGRSGACWQRGFHDHAIRQEEDLRQIARYIIANPLRAGLVNRVGDYPLWDAIWI
ncbi:REP-associated tyrosine transposase [Oceanimonas marisflavi]|uniref:REP-associated tyrosine transposase n=1 Tax=Oceanimonas marisflavi TaxID=2059724 RepID=UPI000D2F8C2C|nr:transposase [Oceanimonas marisflavi]